METSTQAGPQRIVSEKSASIGRRLMSIDALRGFDMFWIMGADGLVYALNRMSQTDSTRFLARQLDHADWAGFRFYDLVFPLFIFIAGVSLVFSLTKTIERDGRTEALKRVFTRTVLLFLLGIFYNGGLSNQWGDVRWFGVLQRIALAYGFAGVLFCCFKPRMLAGICAGLLLGYWAIMAFVPIRDIQLSRSAVAARAEQAGDAETTALLNRRNTSRADAVAAAHHYFSSTTNYIAGKDARATNAVVETTSSGPVTNLVISSYPAGFNLANHFDYTYLPGRKWDTFWDPEGFLSTMPAIASCLLGVFAGLLLCSGNFCDKWKLIYLTAGGVGAVLVGWLWHLDFPVVKKIWTSSYVLVAAGYSALLLATFYWVVDVLKFQKWCVPLVWLGMNPITIYILDSILSYNGIASRFLGGSIKSFFDTRIAQGFGELVICIGGLVVVFLLARFLFNRKIFLRL